MEVNCGLRLSEVVKQKWRLPLNEVERVVTYESQDHPDFLASLFEKNSGFFSKTPGYSQCLLLMGRSNSLHVCFES